ncbi:MAG: alpha/beta fold hydrolase [Ilumatobacteraceae bacterium]
MNQITWLSHNRIRLALHQLREGDGRPLLLLHGLGASSAPIFSAPLPNWPGPVVGLDFTGHGLSTVPAGGGYTTEILLGDADAAVEHLGAVTVLGRGLGGYVALLLAGARPDLVIGAIIDDGPGLSGGPIEPTSTAVLSIGGDGTAPDPYALLELGRDLRPADYAVDFARLATEASPIDEPITVVAEFRPPWLTAVAAAPGVGTGDLDAALARYARL